MDDVKKLQRIAREVWGEEVTETTAKRLLTDEDFLYSYEKQRKVWKK